MPVLSAYRLNTRFSSAVSMAFLRARVFEMFIKQIQKSQEGTSNE